LTCHCSATAPPPPPSFPTRRSSDLTTTDPLTYNTQGTHLIHWTFNDGNGNSTTANQNVIIVDTTPPVTPTLANVTGQCSATATAPPKTNNLNARHIDTTNAAFTYNT